MKRKKKNYTENIALEEKGFAPTILSGLIASPLETMIMSLEKNQFVYKTYVDNYPIWLQTRELERYPNISKLKEKLKVGVPAKFHGSYVEIGETEFDGLISSWEQWGKEG